VEERLNRSDIRSDPADGSAKVGVPLQLALQVFQIRDRRCTPLAGAIVDVWHCDASGNYSGVNRPGTNTTGQEFLRGYQVTNSTGLVQFTTIFPGSYLGRAVHIHFKVRAQQNSLAAHEFTSQLYFDDAVTETVLTNPIYSEGGRWTPNRRDGLFQQGGEELMLALRESDNGLIGNFSLALDLN